MTHYFRNGYIIDSKWTERGKGKQRAVIHSLFFSFSYDPKNSDKAREEAWDLHSKIVPEWAKTTSSREFEEVTSSESVGVGFYYLHILVNDVLFKKVHLRRRRFGQSFFDTTISVIRTFLERLGAF